LKLLHEGKAIYRRATIQTQGRKQQFGLAVKLFSICVVALLLIVAILFMRAILLERSFRQIHTDESEARLLEVVGKPTTIRRCDEGPRKIANDESPGAQRCARVYWYSTYPFADGWLVPIDEAGTIMQINRHVLP
jgi:hypothetical protein